MAFEMKISSTQVMTLVPFQTQQDLLPLQHKIPERILCKEIKTLWKQTHHQALGLDDSDILARKEALQKQVLDANLSRIHEVWENRSGCGCFKKSTPLNSPLCREQLNQDVFFDKWLLGCTYIPQEIIPWIDDSRWVAIAEHALFPMKGRIKWEPKTFLFLQVMALKRDLLAEKVQSWLARAAESYRHWSSSDRRTIYETVITPLVKLALERLPGPFDEIIDTFMKGKPHKRSSILKLAAKTTAEFADRCVKECCNLLPTDSRRAEIYWEVIQRVSTRISDESFKELCENFMVIPSEYHPIFIPHLSSAPHYIVENILATSVAKKREKPLIAAVQQHGKISENFYRTVFLEIRDNARFLAEFLKHEEKLDRLTLGESLTRCTVSGAFDCVRELLKHAKRIPPHAFVKALLYLVAEQKQDPILEELSEKVKEIKPEKILDILSDEKLHIRIKFINHLTKISYPFMSELEASKKEWEEQWNNKVIRVSVERQEKAELTPSPSWEISSNKRPSSAQLVSTD